MSKVFKALLRPPTIFKVAKQFLAIELGTGLFFAVVTGEPFFGLIFTLICHGIFIVLTSREPHVGTLVNIWFLKQLELFGFVRFGFPRSWTPFLYKAKMRCYYER